MYIGMVTPWDVPLGIAEYARDLAEALVDQAALQIVGFDLAGQRADFDTDVAVEELKPCELVHLQYDSDIYPDGQFEALVVALKKAGKKTVVTAHGDPPQTSADCLIVHQLAQVVRHQNVVYMPHGFRFQPTGDTISAQDRSVCVIGSKSNLEPVERALDRIGGGVLCVVSEWKQSVDLVRMMLNNRVVVINYPVGVRLSLAAVLACSVARPLLVSDSNVFMHVRDFPGVAIFMGESRLALDLDFTFANYAQAVGFTRDRANYIEKNNLSFEAFVQRHMELYNKILS